MSSQSNYIKKCQNISNEDTSKVIGKVTIENNQKDRQKSRQIKINISYLIYKHGGVGLELQYDNHSNNNSLKKKENLKDM